MQYQNLKGKKGLIIGIANNKSIAWGCARAFHDAGADLAITYLNDKSEPYVRPLAEQVDASIIVPLNVIDDEAMADLFKTIESKWGKLDFVLHAIAFAPMEDLHGRVVDSSKEGFLLAMDISCHSFARVAKYAEPLMKDGGCLLTTSYHGSTKVVKNYNIMGPVKAALEGVVKYMAYELGSKSIRVNAISPGPIATRAASGIIGFEKLKENTFNKSPMHDNICIDAVGSYARYLVSDDAKMITGGVSYVDAGFNIMAA